MLCLVIAALLFQAAWAVESENVPLGCKWNGHPVCCGLVGDKHEGGYPRPRRLLTAAAPAGSDHHHCMTTRVYVPSAYENEHMQKAKDMLAMAYPLESKKAFFDYILEDIPHSIKWLARVKAHMSSGQTVPEPTDDDWRYLSRFNVTKSCRGTADPVQWVEFIEPLTVHARHPFSMFYWSGELRDLAGRRDVGYPRVDGSIVDYIITKAGNELAREADRRHRGGFLVPPKHYFFDAGANLFTTSMVWFICAYMQRGITFDEVFGWEYLGLNPQEFWKDVPASVVPAYNFYNAPISSQMNASHSVLRFIQDLAHEQDFVSFKLDIDTASIEVPIALQILKDRGMSRLIDEFFFELHFNCEIMEKCCWGNPPKEINGLQLNRYGALSFFRDMRTQGLRAHIWP